MKDKRLRKLELDRVATLRDSERANRFSTNTPSNSFGKSQSRVDVATAHVFAHSPNDWENEAVRGSHPVLNMVALETNLTFRAKFHFLGLNSPNQSDYIIR
jgi:hypothetical protein